MKKTLSEKLADITEQASKLERFNDNAVAVLWYNPNAKQDMWEDAWTVCVADLEDIYAEVVDRYHGNTLFEAGNELLRAINNELREQEIEMCAREKRKEVESSLEDCEPEQAVVEIKGKKYKLTPVKD